MDHNFLLQGVVIGFSIAAPVGPIGVLCIRRTLAEGSLPDLLAGWVRPLRTPVTEPSPGSD